MLFVSRTLVECQTPREEEHEKTMHFTDHHHNWSSNGGRQKLQKPAQHASNIT